MGARRFLAKLFSGDLAVQYFCDLRCDGFLSVIRWLLERPSLGLRCIRGGVHESNDVDCDALMIGCEGF